PNSAIVVMTGNSVGDTVEYTCDDTFTLSSGDVSRECLDDGTWSGEAPTCAAIKCPDPLYEPNSVILTVSGNTIGDVVVYECDDMFKLESGDLTRECLADGSWSGEAPKCEAVDIENDKCASLVHPDNIIVIGAGEGFVYETVVYFCENGYNWTGGDMFRICMPDLTWTGQEPVCTLITCDAPVIPTNTRILEIVTSLTITLNNRGKRFAINEIPRIEDLSGSGGNNLDGSG
ncbi:unnamed protein product, partial [Owenia fusiformis]